MDLDTAKYTLVSNVKTGDIVRTESGSHEFTVTGVEHLGGGLVRLHGPGSLVLSKDSREGVFVA
jgi:hypothetical protein